MQWVEFKAFCDRNGLAIDFGQFTLLSQRHPSRKALLRTLNRNIGGQDFQIAKFWDWL